VLGWGKGMVAAGDEPVAGLNVEKTTDSCTPSMLGNGSTSLKIQRMAVLLLGVVLAAEIRETSWVLGFHRGSAVSGGPWQGHLSTEKLLILWQPRAAPGASKSFGKLC